MDRTRTILTHYSEIARPIIRDYFRIDSCIASTAITIDVLQAFNIPTIPFPCTVRIYNSAFIDRVLLEKHFPRTPQETYEWTHNTGLWSVGIGYSIPDKPMVGHLIAIADNQYFVDASIDQASRPQYNLMLPPVLIGEVNRNFRRAKNGTKLEITGPQGDVLIYEPQPKLNVYLTSKDWTEKERRVTAVNRILTALLS